MDGLVFGDLPASVTSVAVIEQVPAVLLVTLNDLVPETKAALAGNALFTSVHVIPTVSVTVFTTFQFASTAFTVRL